MASFGNKLAGTSSSWLRSVSQCCGSDEEPDLYNEKPILVLHEPELVPPPSAEPLWPRERTYGWEIPDRPQSRKRSISRNGSTGKKGWLFSASSRRPQISSPTNFQHLYSESFGQYPGYGLGQHPVTRPRPRSFRPLELSIYMPQRQLSPIMPHFDTYESSITPPPRARTTSNWDSSSITLTHERSYSSTSFHLPRRQAREESAFSISPDLTPPRVPPRSRARAYTSPSVERIVERIASAMLERERLQAEIDSVIERQSIYINSRPSTAYGLPDLEPMPSIPALPPDAPSFAERLSSEGRPHTAPAQPFSSPKQEEFLMETVRFPAVPSQSSYARTVQTGSPGKFRDDYLERPLAPPLPLVLRPPLRKKKSFSRVSSWLFPGAEHQRDLSLDSITNIPKPVTDRDGYYQCLAPPETIVRTSVDSVTSASSWETTEEAQTVPTTTWSPGSSPPMNNDTPKHTPIVERVPAFGHGYAANRPLSVGVAF